MKVELVSHTPDALELLILTKNTRLKGATLEVIKTWPLEEKLNHIDYMKGTIPGAWEFVDYVFQISEVSRAFTHQLVRTRTASYAQESHRAVDASEHDWVTPKGLSDEEAEDFDLAAVSIMKGYKAMLEGGTHPQDARGLLPTNIHTSIVVKASLRTLSQMAELRLCTRTQGEYQDVFKLMVEHIERVHPWTEGFLLPYCAKTGLCYFPNHEGCPIQKHTLQRVMVTDYDIRKEIIYDAWNQLGGFESKPNAKGAAVAKEVCSNCNGHGLVCSDQECVNWPCGMGAKGQDCAKPCPVCQRGK